MKNKVQYHSLQIDYPNDGCYGFILNYNHHVTTDEITPEDIEQVLSENEISHLEKCGVNLYFLAKEIMSSESVKVYCPMSIYFPLMVG